MKVEIKVHGVKVTMGRCPSEILDHGLRVLVDIPEDRAVAAVRGAEQLRKRLRMVPGIGPVTDAMLQIETAIMQAIKRGP